MLNLQLQTQKDRNEAALIDRRRALEEERKKRIFNPRQRLFGIDFETLEKQIQEKKERDTEQARIDKTFADQSRKDDVIAIALERKQKEERLKLQQEINHFNMCCQRPEDRREFDLNDPNWKKNQRPVRTSDEDDSCGPSSAQKFEGEDKLAPERSKMQKDQLRSWLDQQMKEKESAEKERKEAEEAYREALRARDARALQLDKLEKDCRKRLEDACRRFNKALADERKVEEVKKLEREHQDCLAEMYNFMTSDFLTENPDASLSSMGPNRRIGYMYKGMGEEELRRVRDYQRSQIEEAKNKKILEKRMDAEFNEYISGIQRTINLLDREDARKQREYMRNLHEENKKMAVEQKLQQEFLKKIVYRNIPSPEFFDQFNKSTR